MKDWYSAKELAGKPGLPGTERRVLEKAKSEQWASRRKEFGKGHEYALASLPAATQTAMLMREAKDSEVASAMEGPAKDGGHQLLWQRYERLPDKTKAEARRRLQALDAITHLTESGTAKMDAYTMVAAETGEHPATLRRWAATVKEVARTDWLPALAPQYTGRTATAACSPEAWDFIKADYLRLQSPGLAACYDRLERAAAEHGWVYPSCRTLERRIRKEIPRAAVVLARHGNEALDRIFPAQERDKSALHALQMVNADGHKFDVFVRWPDGTVGRPVILGWQDVYSGMLLAWRVDRTETAELVRLAFGDLVEKYGIPSEAYLDNGRSFASKWITGRMAWRNRFKVKDDEPLGVLTQLGVHTHWTTPYHGQAKPIERAWKDLCETIAKHPANAGAYTGNKPTAKPEDYGSRSVPLAEFLTTVESEINAHNARQGRRSAVCQGRSLADAFNESYAQAPIRKATVEQRRLWLLAAEGVLAGKTGGHVYLLGNRYWTEALAAFMGKRIIVRFDPQQLHTAVHCYTPDGRYIAAADCVQRVGFADLDAARTHAKAKSDYRRATKVQLAAERKLSAAEVAAQLPGAAAPEIDGSKVVKVDFTKITPISTAQDEASEAAFGQAVRMLKGRE